MITEYANFLSDEDFHKAVKLTRFSSGWEFTQNSNKGDGLIFWILYLDNELFFTEYVANKIREATGLDFTIDKVYANGQTYGLCGDIHRDRDIEDQGEFRTFLLYTNPIWYLNWGGFTVFYDDKTGKETIIYPKPNHAVLFDSKMQHVGLEPTRHCTELRTSVAFKLRIK